MSTTRKPSEAKLLATSLFVMGTMLCVYGIFARNDPSAYVILECSLEFKDSECGISSKVFEHYNKVRCDTLVPSVSLGVYRDGIPCYYIIKTKQLLLSLPNDIPFLVFRIGVIMYFASAVVFVHHQMTLKKERSESDVL